MNSKTKMASEPVVPVAAPAVAAPSSAVEGSGAAAAAADAKPKRRKLKKSLTGKKKSGGGGSKSTKSSSGATTRSTSTKRGNSKAAAPVAAPVVKEPKKEKVVHIKYRFEAPEPIKGIDKDTGLEKEIKLIRGLPWKRTVTASLSDHLHAQKIKTNVRLTGDALRLSKFLAEEDVRRELQRSALVAGQYVRKTISKEDDDIAVALEKGQQTNIVALAREQKTAREAKQAKFDANPKHAEIVKARKLKEKQRKEARKVKAKEKEEKRKAAAKESNLKKQAAAALQRELDAKAPLAAPAAAAPMDVAAPVAAAAPQAAAAAAEKPKRAASKKKGKKSSTGAAPVDVAAPALVAVSA